MLTRATAGTTVKIQRERDHIPVAINEKQWRLFFHQNLLNEIVNSIIFAEIPSIKLGIRVNDYNAMTDLGLDHVARTLANQHVQVVIFLHSENDSHSLEHGSAEDSYCALVSILLLEPSCIRVTQVSPFLSTVWFGDLDPHDHGTHTTDLRHTSPNACNRGVVKKRRAGVDFDTVISVGGSRDCTVGINSYSNIQRTASTSSARVILLLVVGHLR